MAVDWTLAEAAAWLNPPVTEAQLKELVHALGIRPVESAAHAVARSAPGRPARRYSAVEIMSLHAAVAPWLMRAGPAHREGAPGR